VLFRSTVAPTTTTVAPPTTTTTPPAGGSTCEQLRRSRAAFNTRIDREEQAAVARLDGAQEHRALARLAETRQLGNAAFDRRLAQCNRASGPARLGSFVSARATLL
jgi:hypothetical protein